MFLIACHDDLHMLLICFVSNRCESTMTPRFDALFCCENIGIDESLQVVQCEKKNSPKLFKRKVWMPFRRI